MSDWAEKVVAKEAKKELKVLTLTMYDKCIEDGGLDRGEARVVVRSLVPEEIAFMRTLVDHWIDTERPPASTT